jgi:hypothetical protein
MAIYCIDDGGDGSQNNTTHSASVLDWSKADVSFADLISYDANAFTTAGNIIYVGDDHNDPNKAAAWALVGPSSGAAITIISADRTNATPTYKVGTGNQMSSLGGAYDITLNGAFRCFGILLNSGKRIILDSDANEASRFVSCTFKPAQAQYLQASSVSLFMGFYNCTIDLGNDASTADSAIIVSGAGGRYLFFGGSVTNATYRTAATCVFLTSGYNKTEFYGFDLSALSSACEITGSQTARFIGCKMPATWTASQAGTYLIENQFYGCLAGALGDRVTTKLDFSEGSITTDTGVTLDSGATSDDGVGGTQQFSLKAVTNSYCHETQFIATDWIYAWNDTTGSRNLDIYVGAGETLDNAEIWAEYLYLGTDDSEQYSFETTQRVNNAAAATYGTTGGAWSGAGAPTEEYYLRSAVTINEKGWVMGRVCVGKASLTAWVDPRIVLS